MSQAIATDLFSTVFPGLALMWVLQALVGGCGFRIRGWGAFTLLFLGSSGLLAVPVGGLSLGRWLASLNANFSIPLTGLLGVTVWNRAFGQALLPRRDWSVGWSWGVVAGLLLYPFALGWGRVDPYGWGWNSGPLFLAAGTVAAALIWKTCRFGLLLLLSVLAYHLQLLESDNYWDYIVDPVYSLLSLFFLSQKLVTWLWARRAAESRLASQQVEGR